MTKPQDAFEILENISSVTQCWINHQSSPIIAFFTEVADERSCSRHCQIHCSEGLFTKLETECWEALNPGRVGCPVQQGNFLEDFLLRCGQRNAPRIILIVDRSGKTLCIIWFRVTNSLIFSLKLTITVNQTGDNQSASLI